MNKKIAVVQSNYIPWKGYFDIINRVDEFILYDNCQFTRRDWRNRNIIKTSNGPIWLTIPVKVKGQYYQKIKDTCISEMGWNRKHWKSIAHNYNKAKHFHSYKDQLEELYLGCREKYLSRINYRFILSICQILGIETKISWAMDYDFSEGRNEALVDLCKEAGASEYVSGPTAKGYIDEALFENNGLKLTYMDYSEYPEYHQLYPPFDHAVSIIDLILNEGDNAKHYMKSFRARE
jgi:hypothetical protein